VVTGRGVSGMAYPRRPWVREKIQPGFLRGMNVCTKFRYFLIILNSWIIFGYINGFASETRNLDGLFTSCDSYYLSDEEVETLKTKKDDPEAAFKLANHFMCIKSNEGSKWLNKAAELGNIEAQILLGNSYSHSAWVDNKMAFKWYSLAANSGNSNAQFHVGKAYEDGEVVIKDLSLASQWYEKAALQGNISAIEQLINLCLRNGNLNENIKAYSWILVAEKIISPKSTYGKDFANKKMNFIRCYQNQILM
jgi:TPR repeat protein